MELILPCTFEQYCRITACEYCNVVLPTAATQVRIAEIGVQRLWAASAVFGVGGSCQGK